MVLAARVMAPEGIGMTTGAALPAGVLSPADRAGFLQQMVSAFMRADFDQLSPDEASEVAANIIRHCLRQGAAEHIQYVGPGARSARGRAPAPAALAAARPVGRNSPCPCGSGKKFKRCCGSRR